MHMLEACMRHFQRQWAWRQEENQSKSIDHCFDNSATDVINAVKLSRNKMEKSPAKAEKSDDKYEYDPNHSDGKIVKNQGRKELYSNIAMQCRRNRGGICTPYFPGNCFCNLRK